MFHYFLFIAVTSHFFHAIHHYSLFTGKLKLPLELPFLSKYLLIAAFLASNNPSRTDRRFFCKRSFGKMSKRAKTSIKTYLSDGKLTGKCFQVFLIENIKFYSFLGSYFLIFLLLKAPVACNKAPQKKKEKSQEEREIRSCLLILSLKEDKL